MTTGEPRDLRDLLPDDVGADELSRLQRVHDLLLAAGPPEELPARLASVPAAGGARPGGRSGTGGQLVLLARARWKAVAVAAAAAAAVLFGIGFASGYLTRDTGFQAAFGPVPMVGGGATSNAAAEIWIGRKDAALNWPSRMKVRGLPVLKKGRYYALWLTDGKTGERLVLCSSFAVHEGVTTVSFSYPGNGQGKGWVIVAEPGDGSGTSAGSGKPLLWTPKQPVTATA